MELNARRFPRLEGRDLQRRVVALPDDLEGERNVVIVAFRREHQELVDSWVPWLEARAAEDPGLRFYEVPTIGTRWSPARPMIDRGMATAIGDPVVLRRTITVYTDIRRVTDGLGIDDTGTVWLFLVDASGTVRWRGRGRFDAGEAVELATALDRLAASAGGGASEEVAGRVQQFDFAFDGGHPAAAGAGRRGAVDGPRHPRREPSGGPVRSVVVRDDARQRRRRSS